MPEKTTQKKQVSEPVRRDWGQQILGGLIGVLVVALVLQAAASFGYEIADRTPLLMAGGVIGAILGSLDRFDQAGARLTGRKDGRGARVLNVIVGVVGMLVVVGLMWALIVLVSWIGRQLFSS
jgi:hypothetical protein